jgi:hypothetical protein
VNRVFNTVKKALSSRAFSQLLPNLFLVLPIFCCGQTIAAEKPAHVRTLKLKPTTAASHEVLIYYASETAPTKEEANNYTLILSWLDGSADEQAKTIATQLRKDLKEFPESVDSEIRDIDDGWKRLDSPLLDVAIFTNRLARAHKFLVSDSNTGRFVERPFNPATSDDYVLSSNTLAQGVNLRRALKTVAEVWPPQTSTFVLITNSHGNGRMAVSPRLIVHGETTSKQELLDVIAGKRTATWTRSGITRADYLRVIAEAGDQQNMVFTVVLPHSCNEDPVNTSGAVFPSNVGTWLEVTGSAPYRMLDYGDLFSKIQAGSIVSAALVNQLKKYARPVNPEIYTQNHQLSFVRPSSARFPLARFSLFRFSVLRFSFVRFAPLLLTLAFGLLLRAKRAL